jgi:hypothetical protein
MGFGYGGSDSPGDFRDSAPGSSLCPYADQKTGGAFTFDAFPGEMGATAAGERGLFGATMPCFGGRVSEGGRAEVWCCGEMEALLQVLMREQERRWEALEEASLIRELHERHALSQESIARLLGKDKSWVCRRLSLLSALPEQVLESVRNGHLSPWAAGRVLVPLARANAEHATALTRSLSQEPLSTRQLWEFFRHYQKANRKQRERMVLDPFLFLKALRAKEEDSRTHGLREGPEGQWLKDMKLTAHILMQLAKALPSVIYPGQGNLDRRLLLTAFEDTRSAFLSLEKHIQEVSAS